MTATGGPEIAQRRELVTEIPGPRSREHLERKRQFVADGVGTGLPIFVTAAGGGVIQDVDGNSLIDLGSGIAVTTSRPPASTKRSSRWRRAWSPRGCSRASGSR
jgi:4-aminobutyrate aminotransferase/(S)-3-amino-2-methylpropionate transaminase